MFYVCNNQRNHYSEYQRNKLCILIRDCILAFIRIWRIWIKLSNHVAVILNDIGMVHSVTKFIVCIFMKLYRHLAPVTKETWPFWNQNKYALSICPQMSTVCWTMIQNTTVILVLVCSQFEINFTSSLQSERFWCFENIWKYSNDILRCWS